MKKQILYSLLVFFSLGMQAQNLSVDLSVEWRREKTYFQDSLLSEQTPYLKITYTNLSADSIYALKPYENRGYVASVPLFIYWLQGLDPAEWKTCKASLASKKLGVLIGDFSWSVLTKPLPCDENTEENGIFDAFYRALIGDHEIPSSNRLPEIEPFSPITERFILDKIKGTFIYLTPSEKKIEYYNLIGFKVIGGEYTYFFSEKEISDYLLSDVYEDKESHKLKHNRMKLPPKVGNYKLYTGPFHTNKLVLSFPGCLRENK